VFGLLSSSAFAATISVSPDKIVPGSKVKFTIRGITAPTVTDWVSIYAKGETDLYKHGFWFFANTCSSKSSGFFKTQNDCEITIPANVSDGTYEFHLNSRATLLAVSNTVTVGSSAPAAPPAISAAPSNVTAGSNVTASFSNVASPTPGDWIGIYTQGAADSAYKAWIYSSSCAQQAGTARSAGSCPVSIPSTYAKGTYELRLFANNSWTRLAVSNTFNVLAPATPPSVSASPSSAVAGNAVKVNFDNVASPTTLDWLGLYAQGTSDTAYLVHIYDNSCTSSPANTGKSSGSCQITLPANLASGQYEFRLMANNTYTRLAVSNSLNVTAATPANSLKLSVSPSTIDPGQNLTVTFSGAEPSIQNYLSLCAPGTNNNTGCLSYVKITACSGTTAPISSGSCQFTVPKNQAAGKYELHFSNVSTFLAASNPFVVTSIQPSTINVTPYRVAPGELVTATYSDLPPNYVPAAG